MGTTHTESTSRGGKVYRIVLRRVCTESPNPDPGRRDFMSEVFRYWRRSRTNEAAEEEEGQGSNSREE